MEYAARRKHRGIGVFQDGICEPDATNTNGWTLAAPTLGVGRRGFQRSGVIRGVYWNGTPSAGSGLYQGSELVETKFAVARFHRIPERPFLAVM